jgi:hypothetical protein
MCYRPHARPCGVISRARGAYITVPVCDLGHDALIGLRQTHDEPHRPPAGKDAVAGEFQDQRLTVIRRHLF